MNKDDTQENQKSFKSKKDKKDKVIEARKISFDGVLRAEDVQILTGLSRVTIWREERAGRFPARIQLTSNRVGWIGQEVKSWMESRQRVALRTSEVKSQGVLI